MWLQAADSFIDQSQPEILCLQPISLWNITIHKSWDVSSILHRLSVSGDKGLQLGAGGERSLEWGKVGVGLVIGTWFLQAMSLDCSLGLGCTSNNSTALIKPLPSHAPCYWSENYWPPSSCSQLPVVWRDMHNWEVHMGGANFFWGTKKKDHMMMDWREPADGSIRHLNFWGDEGRGGGWDIISDGAGHPIIFKNCDLYSFVQKLKQPINFSMFYCVAVSFLTKHEPSAIN